jgi:hypothetical protein
LNSAGLKTSGVRYTKQQASLEGRLVRF